MSLTSIRLGNEIATAVYKKALDQQQVQGQQVLQLIQSAAPAANSAQTQQVSPSAPTDRVGTRINTTA
ncbi:putative motility protein [Motiliproteus sp.]|uniref:putative motility protein n=1 Tax=Motiliproteus sp. TaxID=1898955 RepID=UPI003BA85F34